jgi:hypothetical protein
MKAFCVALIAVVVLAVSAPAPAPAIEPLVTNFGLGTILHPIQEPQSLPVPNCNGACRSCKDHVYIFCVNGWNPLCLGNFNGLCSYLKKQGFEKTYFGQLYTSSWFANKIREIRHTDPEARIVLVGFSLGANYVQNVANELARDDVRVDLLFYLVGDFLTNTPASQPPNVARVVNVRAQGLVVTGGDLFFNGADLDGARNLRLKCRHILAPSRRETVEWVMEELTALAYEPSGAPAPAANTVPVTNAPAPGTPAAAGHALPASSSAPAGATPRTFLLPPLPNSSPR